MTRRILLGTVSALALAATLGIRAGSAAGDTNARGCACCGATCGCSSCSCDDKATAERGCACCGTAACCPTATAATATAACCD